MTHTIDDAEAAIARPPTDLTQLSMAADLMQELGDPRGEDFAACLGGSVTGEELMRKYPADVSAMWVAAWAMADECRTCAECAGTGRINYGLADGDCGACAGMGDDGRAARAEALRLLAECGKVGTPGGGYWFTENDKVGVDGVVADGWVRRTPLLANGTGVEEWDALDPFGPVSNRLMLLDAYASADPETRRRWADETRALTPTAVIPIRLSGADSEFTKAAAELQGAVIEAAISSFGIPPDVYR